METKTNRAVKVCQIGAGLIGRERIVALMNLAKVGHKIELCAVCDPYLEETPDILKKNGLRLVKSVEEIFPVKPDWIFISTPHDVAVELAKKALSRGHNVLLEKPMGRNLREAEGLISCQVRENQLFVGCNYRFYDGISAILADMRNQLFGNIISVNMVLGHGGNPRDKTSWKLDPEKTGGGVLIDPGIHLLDLCNYMFGGKIQISNVLTWRGFWNTGIEEEAHVLMQSEQSIINLQLSVIRWRSTFRIEINGDEGYGVVEGRGRSYGRQRYLRGKRWAWMSGKPQKETEELVVETDGDDVFQKEISALFFGDSKGPIGPCNGKEALASMTLLENCRKQAQLPA
ncbi:MAG: Gfo/Idh/MocA family oxidoreductase [Verrucomicrobiota bacterium]